MILRATGNLILSRHIGYAQFWYENITSSRIMTCRGVGLSCFRSHLMYCMYMHALDYLAVITLSPRGRCHTVANDDYLSGLIHFRLLGLNLPYV